ncbi:hypothetical protein G5B31_03450 [Rhodobacter sp. SGA-6-6]|uniref:hypothetical protein n=1 Tax=Rhodobacter sp. SGA-6-6 TaxID=2710882 RepID=UPI0013EB89E0|nr:hypothetical protein [Rhodobacter sp. SGA-6-6]NGM44584.1 hypothetical protein [Rhodobacter sp. SGA-6-6]
MTDESTIAELRSEIKRLNAQLDNLSRIMLRMTSQATAQYAIGQIVTASLVERGTISIDQVCTSIEGMIDVLRGAKDSEGIIAALDEQLSAYRDPEGSLSSALSIMFSGKAQ